MSGNNDAELALRGRKKTAALAVRILLGVVFLFSGLIKLNDPMGLAFKIEEYFSPGVFNMQFLAPLATEFAVALITLELILGASLLMGRFKVFTLWTLLVLNSGFTIVTFYSALTGKVSDCGCFGDAVHMEPWPSFFKNVALTAMIILLIVWQRFIKPRARFRTAMSVVAGIFAISLGTAYYVFHNEPFVDLRPYKAGVNIPDAMKVPDDAEKPVYENTWVYSVDGVEKEYTDADEPWDIPGAQFVSRTTRLVKKGFEPEITGFSIETGDGRDVTDSILSLERVFVIVSYDIASSSPKKWEKINAKAAAAKNPVIVLANSTDDKYADMYGIKIPVYFADPVTLKTIIRSNPGVVELRRGTVEGKWSYFNIR